MSDTQPQRRNSLGIRLNRALYRFAKNWHRFVIGFLSLLVAGVFAAPILMNLGLTGPATVLYTIYAPLCHQFGFRSIFIGGDQVFYPREDAHSGLKPYEDYVLNDPEFAEDYAYWYEFSYRQPLERGLVAEDVETFTLPLQLASKAFPGNEQMGYKSAVCQRDVAIYTGMLVFMIVYTLPFVRPRLRPLPFLLFVVMGIGPIGIDGFSQLLSYPPFEWLPIRETLPGFRLATGFLFGFMGGWLAFPLLELNMRDIRRQVVRKFQKAGIPLEASRER
ncbi:DUF2085 domain-containing protein [Phototrophicus methaneseepsis]|uniref:DUF2085 domain-containing protein n=1 Tax=Phototrophicus methaneseepsis TaxID=2710758 RepID=A0A7S8IDQ7_9CHLR|nr:DUF2085 domain-containing protein [Phototrophicus methaneseepsis]QPC82875.1 DUF2085 domain-containing protein [Phototrophicus methaneseepsis]